jgi:hypothetical protein
MSPPFKEVVRAVQATLTPPVVQSRLLVSIRLADAKLVLG